ncbi:hypothetical protein [Halomonas sp. YLGW01]|uniref:hypothetical protein n=1 Tax=Halomonas sp. YLGW01 TaxID=2773308 RepID=UPI001780300D|nr:hypothetical protein [Halomonas sp. YLGW01]
MKAKLTDKLKDKFGIMLLVVMMSVVISGCEQEGPAEEAGEKIDNAMEDTGEAIEEAGENVEEAAEEAQSEY